jgi:hypothetical protein
LRVVGLCRKRRCWQLAEAAFQCCFCSVPHLRCLMLPLADAASLPSGVREVLNRAKALIMRCQTTDVSEGRSHGTGGQASVRMCTCVIDNTVVELSRLTLNLHLASFGVALFARFELSPGDQAHTVLSLHAF